MRPRWPVESKVYWCPSCNVPLLTDRCARCGSKGVEVRLNPPADARPALGVDHERLELALKNEFQSPKAYRAVIGGRNHTVLLNKVPYLDEMREVVVDGVVVGKVYYEPVEGKWRFRLTYEGACRILEEGLTTPLKLEPGERLSRARILQHGGYEPGEQVVITDPNGEPLGVGYSTGSRIRVWNVFYSKQRPVGEGPAGREELLRANEYAMYLLESKSMALINVMAEKTGKPVVVSYSGGKDSLVSLDLTLRAGVEPALLFNDTGLEFPETRQAVETAAERHGLKLVVASAGNAFWRSVGFFGPPGRDYRWCCKVAKLAPLARTAKSAWKGDILNIVGQRAFESLDRARSSRIWRNRWVPTILSMSPIQEWNQLAVWTYIWRRGLEPNPLYCRGFERLGCYMCPASTLAEFQVVKHAHPEMWKRWEDILWKWARKIGAPREWVTLGLWRWLGPATQKLRLAKRAGVRLRDWRETYTAWTLNPIVRIEEEELEERRRVRISLARSMPREALAEQHAILGSLSEEGSLQVKRGPVKIQFDGKTFTVEAPGNNALEEAIDAVKLVYRWVGCASCRNCESSCPTGAIRVVEGHPRVRADKCIRCKLCIDNCPVAEMYVEHLALAVPLDTYYSWKRGSRRKREEVVEKAKKLLAPSQPEPQAGDDRGTAPSWGALQA